MEKYQQMNENLMINMKDHNVKTQSQLETLVRETEYKLLE